MKTRRILVLLLAVVFLTGCGQDSIELTIQWPEGSSYRYVQTMDQDITQTVRGQTQTKNQKQVFTYRYDVLRNNDTGVLLESTFERIQQEISNGQSLSFDSENPEKSNHPGAAPLKAMVDRSFKIELDPAGGIKEVTGINEMYDAVFAEMDSLNQQQRQRGKRMLKQFFGEESIKSSFGKAFKIFGGESRTVGEQWTQTLSMEKPIPMKMNNTYTLKRIEEDRAIVSVNSTISPNEEANPISMGNNEMSYMMKGTQSGTTVIHTRNNMIEKSKLHQSLEGTIKLEAGFSDQTIEQNMKIDGVYKLEGERL